MNEGWKHRYLKVCKIQLVITRNFDSFKWQIYKQILTSQFCYIQQQQFKYLMFDLYIYAVLDNYHYT